MPEAWPAIESPELFDWDDARERGEWTGILIGNGSSMAFWDDFGYDSLYEQARAASPSYSLTPEDLSLFEVLKTKNFENVLAAVKTGRTVLQALSRDAEFLAGRYDSVQGALFEAVHAVHVPWGTTSAFEEKLSRIRNELVSYRWVYSLNYDLIIYWALMTQPGARGSVDFFWHGDLTFDPSDTLPPAGRTNDTRVLYLHGRIHLRRHVGGSTFKARAGEQNLLDQFSTTYAGDITPLLVSEGDPDDKFAAILRSDYLEFGYRSLGGHEGHLVIFGCSLRDEDAHLRRAINEQPIPKLAVSLLTSWTPSSCPACSTAASAIARSSIASPVESNAVASSSLRRAGAVPARTSPS